MTRYSFLIEYNGAPYKGWQRQEDMPSVQGALEAALNKLGENDILVQGAGRTDAGVHALGQVAHADLQRPWISLLCDSDASATFVFGASVAP